MLRRKAGPDLCAALFLTGKASDGYADGLQFNGCPPPKPHCQCRYLQGAKYNQSGSQRMLRGPSPAVLKGTVFFENHKVSGAAKAAKARTERVQAGYN
jgi:hypothetical protein